MLITSFKIPLLPPSVNKTYGVNHKKRKFYTSQPVRTFKLKAMPSIPFIDVSKDQHLEVKIYYHGKFYTKAGKIRIKDGQNLDKCLYDVMFKKWGLDDSQVFKGSWEKIHSDEEYTLVEVYRMNLN